MPRILGARPFNRRAIPPLWSGMGDASRSRSSSAQARPIGGNYYALGDAAPTAGFNASVEAWRDDVTGQAGTLPVNFLLAWIQTESNGNPCSWTSLSEAGIFQLMAGDNIAQGGTSLALQHPVPPCVSGSQTTAYRTSLTDDQAAEQVRGGIQYVNYCRSQVDAALGLYGYAGQPGWADSDWSYWCMVKMWHVAPADVAKMLVAGLGGGGIPADWDAMMTYVSGIPTSWTDNARKVGINGDGGGSLATAALGLLSGDNKFIVIAALGVGLLYLLHKNR
jgi:hypothetical protein